MKISILSTMLFLASLLLTPLSAQEMQEKITCSDVYDLCAAKCEALDKGFTECIDKCDAENDKCSEQEEKEESK